MSEGRCGSLVLNCYVYSVLSCKGMPAVSSNYLVGIWTGGRVRLWVGVWWCRGLGVELGGRVSSFVRIGLQGL